MTSYNDGTNAISYTYDASGLRASKTINGGTTVYQYVGDKLYYEQRADGSKMYYFYDTYGNLAYIYRFTSAGNAKFNVVTNSQGDVIAIYNWDGNQLVASYEYDAWGNCTITQDTTGIGAINPIRYRGYYYDSETGLYYLQSRYYDPSTGRFINADGYITTGQGVLSYNMFAYCMNNPVMLSDPSGELGILGLLILLDDEEDDGVVNSVTRGHYTTKTGGFDLGTLFGKIETSATETTENRRPSLFYSFTDNGNYSEDEVGVGFGPGKKFLEIGINKKGNFFLRAGEEAGMFLPGLHGEVSFGIDGIGLSAGIEDKIGLSNDIDINIGWGSWFILFAPKVVSDSEYQPAYSY